MPLAGGDLLFAATALLVALGLDNAAVAASIGGPWRRWLAGAAPLGVAALVLATLGALLGRLLRQRLHGWTQLIGATLLFALAVDALREATSDRPRVAPEEVAPTGSLWRRAATALAGNLDELGVGFAFGGTLGAFGLGPWGAACLLETAAALAGGYALRGWAAEGRRLSPWSALVLFIGASLLLLLFPIPAGLA